MEDVAERLAHAADAGSIGEIVADACTARVPFAIFSYLVVEPAAADRQSTVLRSTEFSPEWLAPRFPAMVLALERDLPGGVARLIEFTAAYDIYEKFPVSTIAHTALWNDHWRPVGCSQHLCAPLWREGAPVGYFAMTRGRREPLFTPSDLRELDALQGQAERALLGVASLGRGDLARTLEALSLTYPYPAFLFEACGRLRWLSEEAVVRLGVAAARFGGGCLVRGNDVLEGLRRCARALASDPAFDPTRALRRQGAIRPTERIAVRCFGEVGATFLLLAVTPAMATVPGESAAESAAPLPGLGAVESRIARLAAEGYTVLNIASLLGVAESTVRTHLRRVYLKLGVHGRAELSMVMYRGAPGAVRLTPPDRARAPARLEAPPAPARAALRAAARPRRT